ncbi:MAG: glycoside hydrolase family 25 protein [Christensenellaceae bacterium]
MVMKIKGIDVSEWQEGIHWKNAKKDGVVFGMLRAGYGSAIMWPNQYDKTFEQNYKWAKEAGVNVGAYWYSYASTTEQAREEASAFLATLKGKQFEYPVAMDVEETCITTEAVKAFCSEMEGHGYYVMIYANLDYLNNRLDMSQLTQYDVWCADWSDSCGYSRAGIWQYTAAGSVNGIKGRVDMNYSFLDYASVIKDAGLNGYKAASDDTVPCVEAKKILEKLAHAKQDIADIEAMVK